MSYFHVKYVGSRIILHKILVSCNELHSVHVFLITLVFTGHVMSYIIFVCYIKLNQSSGIHNIYWYCDMYVFMAT